MFVILGAKIWKKNGNEKNGGENDEIWGYFGREWRKMAAKHGCNRDGQKTGATGTGTGTGRRPSMVATGTQTADGDGCDGDGDGKAPIDGRDGKHYE